MARKIEAEFSKGVIIPLEKLDLEEGKKITITIEEVSFEKKKDVDFLRKSFGGWKNLIDAERLKRNIYNNRLISTRSTPKKIISV